MIINKTKLELRQANIGIDTKTLAKKAKITAATIYAAKQGRAIRPTTLHKIAKALDCNPSDLLCAE